MAAELTLGQIVRMLERMEGGWPDHLQLFSASGNLCLIDHRVHGDGEVHENAVVWSSVRIYNDGGDPDWVRDGEYEPREALPRRGLWVMGVSGRPRPADKTERRIGVGCEWAELAEVYGPIYETEL